MSSTPPTPADPESEATFEYYVAGLVDVLSQRDDLMAWARIKTGEDADPAFLSALQNSVGKILNVRQAVRSLVVGYGKPTEAAAQLSQIPPELREQFERFRVSKMGAQFFSDTSVAYAPLQTYEGVPLLKDVWGIVAGLGYLMLMCLSSKIAIRGAIEVGAGTNAFSGELYGPCLAVVHQLESEVAQYPRIVIGRSLHGLLRQLANNTTAVGLGQITADLARDLLDLVLMDDDGELIVDFLNPFFAEHAPASPPDVEYTHARLVERAYEWVRSEHDRFRKSGNTKLAARYARPRRYFDFRLGADTQTTLTVSVDDPSWVFPDIPYGPLVDDD